MPFLILLLLFKKDAARVCSRIYEGEMCVSFNSSSGCDAEMRGCGDVARHARPLAQPFTHKLKNTTPRFSISRGLDDQKGKLTLNELPSETTHGHVCQWQTAAWESLVEYLETLIWHCNALHQRAALVADIQ